jgi:hypothetical protein
VKDAGTEKRQKLIRVVLILGALYVAYDTFLAEPGPGGSGGGEVLDIPDAQPTKPKRPKPPVADAQPNDAPPVAETPAMTDVAPVENPVADTPVETAPAEAPTTTEGGIDLGSASDMPVTDTAPIEAKAGEGVELNGAVSDADVKINQIDLGIPSDDVPTDTATTATETAPADSPTDTTVPQMGDMDSPDVPTTESGTTATAGEGDMTEMILKDLEKQMDGPTAGTTAATGSTTSEEPISTVYITPPNYENVGRGLVYNCLGKHWACIDGPSFKICQQNKAALESQGKRKECVPDSVYQTDSGCGWVQRQKITGNAKTDFCN